MSGTLRNHNLGWRQRFVTGLVRLVTNKKMKFRPFITVFKVIVKRKLKQLMCEAIEDWIEKKKLDKLAGYIFSITAWILCVYQISDGWRYLRMNQIKFFKGCLPQILFGIHYWSHHDNTRYLTHFRPVSHFYTLWKRQKPLVSDVFRGYRNVTLD